MGHPCELVAEHVRGFYEQQGWGPNFVISNRSTFFAGDFQTPLTPGATIPIRGNAFAGNRGVASVDVSPDAGQTWLPARIDYPGTDLTWAYWSFDWQPRGPGDYTPVARTTDRQGVVQTGDYQYTQPQGATGFAGRARSSHCLKRKTCRQQTQQTYRQSTTAGRASSFVSFIE